VIEARVLEEIRRELPPGTVPSRAAAAGLTYLTQVLKETVIESPSLFLSLSLSLSLHATSLLWYLDVCLSLA
jgi:hypothetical protein